MVPRPDAKAAPVQIGFSVPKKKFRSSVDRHRVKRLMWEVWRLNKHTLYTIIPPDKQLHVFLMFTDKQIPIYDTVHSTLVKAMNKLAVAVADNKNIDTIPPAE